MDLYLIIKQIYPSSHKHNLQQFTPSPLFYKEVGQQKKPVTLPKANKWAGLDV
jgi:hypothetical protein